MSGITHSISFIKLKIRQQRYNYLQATTIIYFLFLLLWEKLINLYRCENRYPRTINWHVSIEKRVFALLFPRSHGVSWLVVGRDQQFLRCKSESARVCRSSYTGKKRVAGRHLCKIGSYSFFVVWLSGVISPGLTKRHGFVTKSTGEYFSLRIVNWNFKFISGRDNCVNTF